MSKFNFSENSNEATTSVKIGDLDVLITLNTDSNKKCYIEQNDTIDTLTKAGIPFEQGTLLEEYKKALDNIDIIRQEAKAKKRKDEYFSLWFHSVKFDDDIETKFITFEEYCKNIWSRSIVKISYKGISGTINKTKVGGSTWRANSGTTKFQLSGNVTDHKNRNYSTLEKALKKFKELCIEKNESNIAKAKREEIKKTNEESMLQFLNEMFNNKVIQKEEYKSSYNIRHNGYYVTRYYLTNIEQQISYNKKDNNFNLGSIKNISLDKVNEIIKILKK